MYANQVEIAKFNLTLAVEWVRYADTKATFFMATAVAMLGVSLTEVPLATNVVKWLFNTNWDIGAWAIIVAHAVFYAAIVYSGWLFLTVVRPALIAKSEKHSWFFFQSMALLSADEFHRFTETIGDENILSQLHDQIYNNCVVARDKFKTIKHAFCFLILACVAAFAAISPVLVLSTFLPVSP